jgi:hypothetical protein
MTGVKIQTSLFCLYYMQVLSFKFLPSCLRIIFMCSLHVCMSQNFALQPSIQKAAGWVSFGFTSFQQTDTFCMDIKFLKFLSFLRNGSCEKIIWQNTDPVQSHDFHFKYSHTFFFFAVLKFTLSSRNFEVERRIFYFADDLSYTWKTGFIIRNMF